MGSLEKSRRRVGGSGGSISRGGSGGGRFCFTAAATFASHSVRRARAISLATACSLRRSSKSSSSSASSARTWSITASSAGLLPALGLPIFAAQMTGGSVQPAHGLARRTLATTAPAADRSGIAT